MLSAQELCAPSDPGQLLVTAKSPMPPMLEIVRAAVPLLVSVTGCAALVLPTACDPKVKFDADSATTGATPVPVRATVCGLPVALSAIVIVPASLPEAVGPKLAEIVQLAPAARLEPQVLVSAYPALAVMLVMLKAPVPGFVTVRV